MSGWFIGAVAIGLVLLPIPELVLNLRKAASLQRAVIEAATDGILVVSSDGKVQIHNQRLMDFWHIPSEYLNTTVTRTCWILWQSNWSIQPLF